MPSITNVASAGLQAGGGARAEIAGATIEAIAPTYPKIQVSRALLEANLSLNVQVWDGTQVKSGRIGAFYGGAVHYPG